MDPTEEHLLALAEGIMTEHGLDPADVMSLADDVSGMMRQTSYPSQGKLPQHIHGVKGNHLREHVTC